MRTVVGRLSAGLDESEFDALPAFEHDIDAESAAWLPHDDVLNQTTPTTPTQAAANVILGASGWYVPPGMAPSPDVAARLLASQQNLANVRAQLLAEQQVDSQLGPLGILQMQQQQAALAQMPYGAMPSDYYDDGSSSYGPQSSSASDAVNAFRNDGVDPFADDDVLGFDTAELDDLTEGGDFGLDVTDAAFDHQTASVHRGGAGYLDPTYPLGGRSQRGPVDVVAGLMPPLRRR
jgi:hypothetical protein